MKGIIFTALVASVCLTYFLLHQRSSCAGREPIRQSGATSVSRAPIELHLELGEFPVRSNSRYTIAYAATLKNVLQSHLLIAPDFFRQNVLFDAARSKRRWFRLEIRDEGGREVRPVPALDSNQPIPYRLDAAADRLPRLEDEMAPTWIMPGEEWRSLSSILAPFEYAFRQEMTARGPATIKVPRSVKLAGYEAPPPGYRILDRFIFRQPGRYSVRVVFDDDVSVIPAYRWADKLPKELRRALALLGLSPAVPLTRISIHAGSETRWFEVKP
jgi:hypothetical protein